MRWKPVFAVVAIVVGASACGGSSKSTSALPQTAGTVGSRAGASETARSAALVKKAAADYAQGHTALAKSEYLDAVRHDANNKNGWFSLGVIAQTAKDTKGARTDYEHAITIDPHYESALYNFGVLLFSENDLDLSISALERAVLANPNDANAHWNLGLALAKRNNGSGDTNQSTLELNKALKLNRSLARGLTSSPTTAAP